MQLPNSYNYIGLFLTFRCCYNCSYCINWKNLVKEVDSEYWINCLKNLETDLSVTLSGGEPSLYKGFYEVINGIPQKIDLLTNLQFDVSEFKEKVSPDRFDNSQPFAPIRASFHNEFMDIEETLRKVDFLMEAGFRIGLYCVDHVSNKYVIEELSKIKWLDFQVKPLLDNSMKESFEFSLAKCRTGQLLLNPEGKIFKCHRDLYKMENEIGFLDSIPEIDFKYEMCNNAKECHPCDTKIKRDRFGREGYCAVDIKNFNL